MWHPKILIKQGWMYRDGVYLSLEWCEGTKNVLSNFIFCVFLHKSRAQNTEALRDLRLSPLAQSNTTVKTPNFKRFRLQGKRYWGQRFIFTTDLGESIFSQRDETLVAEETLPESHREQSFQGGHNEGGVCGIAIPLFLHLPLFMVELRIEKALW